MLPLSSSSDPLFSEDRHLNLYYLNRLYQCVADSVSRQMRERYDLDIPITSGIWGGTYLITDQRGQCRNRVHRMYCLINLPLNSPLDDKDNLNRFMEIYQHTFVQAFKPHGIFLNPESWGEKLPYGNLSKPSFIMHLSEVNQRIRWLRAFVIWNLVPWEESVIHDTIRNIKVLKELLNIRYRPAKREAEELKFLMQDVIITYRTLEKALSADFIEHAKPIIEELTGHYLAGLHDPELIWELYLKVFSNALIYGFEEALEEYYGRAGLDIHQAEHWPADKINYVPEDLKEKLIPPIKVLFAEFEKNLHKDSPLN